jgi:threonine-phosphate decarboxylase
MSKATLRIEQYQTVHFDTNVNPLGTPDSVKRAIQENIDAVVTYPDVYYDNLKKAISEYVDVSDENVVLGNGSSDILRLFAALVMPKKALLLSPGPIEYEHVLKSYGSEVDFFDLSEEEDFEIDLAKLCHSIDSSYDMIIISNPNNPSSKSIDRESMEILAKTCKELDVFLLIDEMYVEFTDNESALTSIPLTKKYENIAVMRSVSKFFAVPGIRLAYAVHSNPDNIEIINITSTKNNLASLSAVAGTVMLSDRIFIEESKSMIHTERSLVYLAMSTCKTIKLYKPEANFMLCKLLKDNIDAKAVAEHCRTRGIIIRDCSDIRGLGSNYIRFSFMKPKQNDLMVNTILEIV